MIFHKEEKAYKVNPKQYMPVALDIFQPYRSSTLYVKTCLNIYDIWWCV